MTGTVTSASGSNTAVAVGDHIVWTLQYDPATPVTTTTTFGPFFSPNGPVLSHLVDQTKGIPLYTPSPANLRSSLMLSNFTTISGFYASDTQRVSGIPEPANLIYETQLFLGPGSPLASMDLTKFHPDRAGFVWGSQGGTTNELMYFDNHLLKKEGSYALLFTAAVDSLSVSTTPEPGSLTLFVLGAVGLAARRLRRWLTQLMYQPPLTFTVCPVM